jgi:putative ABC transport system permease protein
MKVLGATRGEVTRIFLLEFGLLGLGSAIIAIAVGSIAAWLLVTRVMHADWAFMPGRVALTALLAVAVALAIGFAGTWRALGTRPAPLLRNE